MALALRSAGALVQRTGVAGLLVPRQPYAATAGGWIGSIFQNPTRIAGAIGFGLLGLLNDLLEQAILRAVPKQRTSHSKKRMRMANKGLKNRKDIVPCPGCGRPKLISQICKNCYKNIKHTLKDMKRAQEQQES
ncbi:hypothetical protein IWW48_001746 [Coemansia sp. RSA 1200]|nr:hypothetical protein IWW48_001746 [Coemansia sp. RSA 1200]